MHNIHITTKCSKKHIRTLTTIDPIPISYLSETIFKWSYWNADKNIHDIGKKAHLGKRKFIPRKKSSFQVEWWRRFRTAACKTHELLAQYLETSLTILNENCWSTDTNMCNIGKMTDVSKRTLVPLSLKDPIPIWSYNVTILKGSCWCTDKNIHDIGKF